MSSRRRDLWSYLLQLPRRWNLSAIAAIGNKKLLRWLALFTSRTWTTCLSLFEAASQQQTWPTIISATLTQVNRCLNLRHQAAQRWVKHHHPMSIQESRVASKVNLSGFKSLKHLAKDRLQDGSLWLPQCLSIVTLISSSEEARSANQTMPNLKYSLLNPSSRETTVTICLSAHKTPRRKGSHLMKSRRSSTKMKTVKRALLRIANSLHRSRSQSKGPLMTASGTISVSLITQARSRAAASLVCH